MAIDPIRSGADAIAAPARTGRAAAAASPAGFADTLGRLVDHVERTGAEANQAVAGMMNKTTDVHEAMIALQRAEMALQLTVQIRNKLVQAYQDIMRMPV